MSKTSAEYEAEIASLKAEVERLSTPTEYYCREEKCFVPRHHLAVLEPRIYKAYPMRQLGEEEIVVPFINMGAICLETFPNDYEAEEFVKSLKVAG